MSLTTHKRTRLFFVFSLAFAIAALTLLACGESTNNAGTATDNSKPPNGNTSTSSNTTPHHFKVGQQVKVGDTWNVTLDSVKTSPGSQYIKPKGGNVYLLVTISMKNASNQEQNVSSLANFSLQDSSGQKYTETIDPDAGTAPDGKVEAGSPIKGTLVYEVPTSMHLFTFSFAPDMTSSGQTIWDIKD